MFQRSIVLASVALCALLGLAGCNNSPGSKSLERSLAADPKLEPSSPTTPLSQPPTFTSQPPSPQSPTPQPASAASPSPSSSDPNFIGPVLPSNLGATNAATNPETASSPPATPFPDSPAQTFSDLAKAPADLRESIEELAALGILSESSPTKSDTKSDIKSDSTLFNPNQPVTRRDYVRWLVAANNRFYRDRPAQQIRPAADTAQPAFTDVLRTDPDFPVIQGLAEAGILSSSLSGDATTTTFRPDAPLSRETLLFWKVPLDTRQALPRATLESVQQTWGFQDTGRIDPKVLRTVLADFQNGDQSNIRRVFGYTTLFQPKKPVTRAEAAATLAYFGSQGEGLSAKEVLEQERTTQSAIPSP